MGVIDEFVKLGLVIEVIDGKDLSVKPKALLNEEIRVKLKERKQEIIQELLEAESCNAFTWWQILHPNGLVNEEGYSPAIELIAVKANYPDAIKIVPNTESVNWWEIERDQTDEESDLMRERHQSFIAKGLKVEQAQEVAQLLLYRDRDCDDRRSCAECGMYNFGCHRGLEPIGGGGVLVLHQCVGWVDTDHTTSEIVTL